MIPTYPNKAVDEIRSAKLALQFASALPRYKDNDKIVNGAINAMCQTIDKWHGVQFSKEFIAEFEGTGKIMEAKKFDTIAKNHQDQTSWQICGQRLFAPYIAEARQVMHTNITYVRLMTWCCDGIYCHGALISAS